MLGAEDSRRKAGRRLRDACSWSASGGVILANKPGMSPSCRAALSEAPGQPLSAEPQASLRGEADDKHDPPQMSTSLPTVVRAVNGSHGVLRGRVAENMELRGSVKDAGPRVSEGRVCRRGAVKRLRSA